MKFSDATSEGYKVFDSIPEKWHYSRMFTKYTPTSPDVEY